MTGGSVTTEMAIKFGTEATAGVPLVSVSTTTEVSFSVAATLEHSLEQSTVRTLTISCPDGTPAATTTTTAATPGATTSTTAAHRLLENPEGLALEYLYQWEVSDGVLTAKTEHFRCYQSEDGKEYAPQCSPFECGDPWRNAKCEAYVAGVENGADERCRLT